jgi:hypothetical protein
MTKLYEPMCLDPKKIKSLDKVLLVLKELDDFKETNNCEGVVALLINRHLGGTYIILSKDYVEESMKNPGYHEWFERFHDSSYYENLKKNY